MQQNFKIVKIHFAFADVKINMIQDLKFMFGGVENILGKRKKAGHQIFSLNQIGFKSFLPQGHLNSGLCGEGFNPLPDEKF